MAVEQRPELDVQELLGMPETVRGRGFERFFQDVAGRPEEERQAALRSLITAESELDDGLLEAAMRDQLRSWARLDRETATAVACDYERLLTTLPGLVSMRQTMAIQTTALHQLSAEDLEAVAQLMPEIFRGMPHATPEEPPEATMATADAVEAASQSASRSKRWWRVW